MRHAIIALLATSALAGAGDYDLRARAASAAALAELEGSRRPPPEVVTKSDLCPCSRSGLCYCTPASQCGCITNREFRWVATAKSNQVALYKGSLQLGNWWHDEQQFKMLQESYNPPRWVPFPCPVDPPSVKPLVYRIAETPATAAPVQWQLPPFRQPTFPPLSGSFPVHNGGGFRGGVSCGPGG